MNLGHKNFIFLFFILVVLNYSTWNGILKADEIRPGFYFLNVGQGDSELAIFSGGEKLLTDAGPDKSATGALEGVLGKNDDYIDLGLITHAQLDHYGGFSNLLDNYIFGAILWSGRDADSSSREWAELKKKISDRNIPLVRVQKGSRVSAGFDYSNILSPDGVLLVSKDINESGIVQKVSIGGESAILAADIAKKAEARLLASGEDLTADILKIPHHGSKTSLNTHFLTAISPTVAVIEVGKKNRYGHPTAEVLNALKALDIRTLRTDMSGTSSLFPGEDSIFLSSQY